jgi:hypothetical protein
MSLQAWANDVVRRWVADESSAIHPRVLQTEDVMALVTAARAASLPQRSAGTLLLTIGGVAPPWSTPKGGWHKAKALKLGDTWEFPAYQGRTGLAALSRNSELSGQKRNHSTSPWTPPASRRARPSTSLQTVERTLAETQEQLQAEVARRSEEEKKWTLDLIQTEAEGQRLGREVRRLLSGEEQDLAARERLLERNEAKQFAEAVEFQAEVCRTALFCCVSADLLMVTLRSRRLRCFGATSSSRLSAHDELNPRCVVWGAGVWCCADVCADVLCVTWWCVCSVVLLGYDVVWGAGVWCVVCGVWCVVWCVV